MASSKKKILVVGGAGYIGGAVTDILMQSGAYDFRVYDNLTYEESYRKPVDFVYGDILDHDGLKEELDWSDCVIWLAAIVGDGASSLNEILTIQTNQEMLRWLASQYRKRIIFTSTCSVYGAQNDVLLSEASPIDPISLYAHTKFKAEEYLRDSDAVIFRLGTLFGVSDTYSRIRMDLVVNLMTVKAFTAGTISVFGGDQYRPLLHVRDAAKAIVQSIEFDPLRHAEIFNLSAINITISDLADQIKKRFPKLVIERTDISFQDARNYKVTWDKAEKFFGFKASYTIDDGVRQLLDLFKKHRIKNFSDSHFSNQAFLKNFIAG
ncbi:MAG: NAD-dependent dehydratase [Parcubacteria group bacterium RIFCSPHIGHO2_01_FULL_47_10b]|nr:MAG: NAD-dependent dehydratase [Parcubacteria group bacterium RIFCSPHIGHO2_01_FULL_47_10b]